MNTRTAVIIALVLVAIVVLFLIFFVFLRHRQTTRSSTSTHHRKTTTTTHIPVTIYVDIGRTSVVLTSTNTSTTVTINAIKGYTPAIQIYPSDVILTYTARFQGKTYKFSTTVSFKTNPIMYSTTNTLTITGFGYTYSVSMKFNVVKPQFTVYVGNQDVILDQSNPSAVITTYPVLNYATTIRIVPNAPGDLTAKFEGITYTFNTSLRILSNSITTAVVNTLYISGFGSTYSATINMSPLLVVVQACGTTVSALRLFSAACGNTSHLPITIKVAKGLATNGQINVVKGTYCVEPVTAFVKPLSFKTTYYMLGTNKSTTITVTTPMITSCFESWYMFWITGSGIADTYGIAVLNFHQTTNVTTKVVINGKTYPITNTTNFHIFVTTNATTLPITIVNKPGITYLAQVVSECEIATTGKTVTYGTTITTITATTRSNGSTTIYAPIVPYPNCNGYTYTNVGLFGPGIYTVKGGGLVSISK